MHHIPLKESSQPDSTLANGKPDLAYGSAASAGAMWAYKLKFSAVAGLKRIADCQSIPTMAETDGSPGLEVGGWVAMMAPGGTAAAIVRRVNDHMEKSCRTRPFGRFLPALALKP